MNPTQEHIAFMDELKAALATVPDMPSLEILALVSQFLGAICAAQDARLSSEYVMGIVSRNVMVGNQECINVNITRN